MGIILQKAITSTGYCSRREATDLILNKKVLVNGKLAEPGMTVDESDKITIAGKPLNQDNKIKNVYIKLNKPIGYVCTTRNFDLEKNVLDLVNINKLGLDFKYSKNLFVVGRLDKESHGLVILTNDGDYAYKTTHPKYEIEKVYKAKAIHIKNGLQNIVERFLNGIDIGENDGIVFAKSVKKINKDEYEITLIQGKKRQIRRMFAELGYKVVDLKRVSIGKVKLNDLRLGEFEFFDIK